MPRVCTVCQNDERGAIDEALVRGTPFRNVAKRHSLSVASLFRHRKEHIPVALVKVEAARKGAEAETLFEKVARYEEDVHRLRQKAEAEGDLRCALVGMDKSLDIVKLQRELMPVPGSDARSLAEQLARARAERLTVCVVPYDQMLSGQISPHEALERLVKDGYLTQDEADEAMRRKRVEAEPRLKALGPVSVKPAEGAE